MNLSLLSPSRTVRQWIAREWLYLLAGFVWAYILAPIVFGLVALVVKPRFYMGPSDFIRFGPYVIFQLVRMTMWAIRTVRGVK